MKSSDAETKCGLHIAAVTMQAAGLCRYGSPLQCRRFYPPTDNDCVDCIEKWLLAKARREIKKEEAKP